METWNNGMPEGLTTAGAQKLLEKYGRNELTPQKKESFFKKALHVMAEPMFLLLMIASVIYFILGEPRDGAVMLLFGHSGNFPVHPLLHFANSLPEHIQHVPSVDYKLFHKFIGFF